MKQYLSAAALLLIGSATAHAQIRFGIGPVGAYTLFTGHFQSNDPNVRYSAGYHHDFAAGVLADIGLGHFALQPSLQWARKGYSRGYSVLGDTPEKSYAHDGYIRFDYLCLPLNFVYTQQANGQGWQVLAGPYLSILTGGQFRDRITAIDLSSSGTLEPQEETGNVSFGPYYDNHSRTYYARRTDFGLQGGLGYRAHRLLFQATYSVGLLDIAVPPYGGYLYRLEGRPDHFRNHGFQCSATYLFGGKS